MVRNAWNPILAIPCEAKPISDFVRQERQILARLNLGTLLVAISSENDAIGYSDVREKSLTTQDSN